jgi:hypothetical protein
VAEDTTPLAVAETNVTRLLKALSEDPESEAKIQAWQKAESNLAVMTRALGGEKNRPRSGSLRDGEPAGTKQALSVSTDSYKDRGDHEWDTLVALHRDTEAKRLDALGVVWGRG